VDEALSSWLGGICEKGFPEATDCDKPATSREESKSIGWLVTARPAEPKLNGVTKKRSRSSRSQDPIHLLGAAPMRWIRCSIIKYRSASADVWGKEGEKERGHTVLV